MTELFSLYHSLSLVQQFWTLAVLIVVGVLIALWAYAWWPSLRVALQELRSWGADLFRDEPRVVIPHQVQLSQEEIDEADDRLIREIAAMRREATLHNVRPVSPEVEARIRADFDRIRNHKPLRVVGKSERTLKVEVS